MPLAPRTRFLILMAGLALLVFAVVFAVTSMVSRQGPEPLVLGRDRVGVVKIEGVILDATRVIESLKEFGRDRSIKGIILRINSPGGAVAPAQEIYAAVRRLRDKEGKKVVASCGNVAASGAYYVAAAADRIVANPGTITGSIGVIMELSNIQGLLEKIGIQSYVIKSGEFKDIGSVTRPMTEEEKRILQSVIDDVYMQFVEDVAAARNMEVEKVRAIANGSIFSGRQAKGLGLVDQLGSFQDAVDALKEMAGIRGEPAVVYEKGERPRWMEYLTESLLSPFLGNRLAGRQAGAFYLLP